MTIRGGYDDCLDNSPSGRTVLDANGSGTVFDIWLQTGDPGPMNVVLENLVIRGGDAGFLGGGGLLVEGRQGQLAVELINTEVTNNNSVSNGGGIRVAVNASAESSGPILTLDDDSSIVNNTAGGNGGGLACDNPDNHSSLVPSCVWARSISSATRPPTAVGWR